ncbi:hypothetical protein, partial [Streptomyces sp. NPDC059349]|uniref:hypothetical protein n=1 Tax=Streptomyces sp. NPDC059349 TaxID=3346808 RepID=UPI0036BA7DEA
MTKWGHGQNEEKFCGHASDTHRDGYRGRRRSNATYLRNGKDFDVGRVRVTGRGFGAEFLPVGMDVDTLDGSWTTAVPSARV